MPGPTTRLAVRQVPLLDLGPQNQPLRSELEAALKSVWDSQRFILGSDVEGLEREVADYLKVEHAIGCASGTDALILALAAYGIGPGDEVIVPAFTFFATAGAVCRVGAVPVFADIDPVTFNLDPESVKEAARGRERIRAMIPVHLFGGAAEMDSLLLIAAERGWRVIEDGAQAIGAEYRGRRCLGLGGAGTLSFFPSKNLGAMGDAGMVTTNDAALAERLRALRVHGSREKYRHEWVGFNSRLDTVQAAVLRVKLRYLDEWTEGRRRNAMTYGSMLEEARPGIGLPVQTADQTRHVWNQYVIRSPRRDELRRFLAERGIGTEIYYPIPLHLQPCFADLNYWEGQLPEAERACREVLALPVHSGLREGDVDYVCQTLKDFGQGESSGD